jgi:N-acylneuraminate cytidylyltransferase
LSGLEECSNVQGAVDLVAIIPARGGSKGIPRKNVTLLAGKPLLAWMVEAALAALGTGNVYVSTDDPEIAAVAEQYGAAVVWRPAEISGDTASSELALLHALDYLERHSGRRPEITVFLQCTAPLTLPQDILGTIQVLLDGKADTALAVTPFHYFLWRVDESSQAVGVNHDRRVRRMRQEREPEYLEAGAVYVMRTQGFKRAEHRFFGKTALYVMPSSRCLEIDEPVDLEMAEMLLCRRRR